MASETLKKLPGALLPWYREHKRDLPWRRDRECYHVWLSEIMLQQTRVEAVKGYYTRFLDVLPTIADLATCDDDTLHKLWEGLGYYSRVRNLKKAACIVTEQYGGVFPREYEAVRALPGIGDYTAGAILSICFDAPAPAVDGNVLRVVARLLEDETPIDLPACKRAVRDALAEIYPPQAGEFTQALMELGATVCGPNRAPDCAVCPCRDFCASALHGTASRFPVRLPKKARRDEEKTVFILSCCGKYALQKRPDTGLLAGLWQLPNVSGTLGLRDALDTVRAWGITPREVLRQTERTHIFTHITWHMRGYYLETDAPAGPYTWLSADEIRRDAALPTAFRQFMEDTDHV